MKKHYSLICAAILLLCQLTASAQTNNSSEEPIDSLSMVGMELNLDQTVVVADRKYIVYKIDKKTISAASDIYAAGGTAVDILESTPSIRVNADGDVTFRGSSGFKVYINGKPAISEGSQALQQVPASQIENIEIITTPSAKYETDGDVGMINIITKKETEQGLNGAFNLSGSTLGSYNFDMLLNKNIKDHRIYAGATAFDIRSESDFNQKKTTIMDGITTTSDSKGPRTGHKIRYTGKIGYEYDNRTTLFRLEGEVGYTERNKTGDMDYSEVREGDGGQLRNNYNSYDVYSINEKIAIGTATFSHKFNDKGHQISASAYVKYDWGALEYYESNMFDSAHMRVDGSLAYEREHRWNNKANLDYVLPYSATGKLEAGYQFSWYVEDGNYSIKFWDKEAQKYVWRDDLYNVYYYNRTMNSAYLEWSDRVGAFNFQAGLRADQRRDYLDITMKDCSRDKKFLELFPSAHIGYNGKHSDVVTFGYSYRTNRPNIWQLEPYITYEDYYTAMVGNPDIKSEYIHAFELNYRKNFGEKHSLSVTGFYRGRKDKIDRIRVAYLPGVTLDSLANVGKDKSYGLEMSGQFRIAHYWTLIANGSAYFYNFWIYNPNQGRDVDSFNYEAYLGNTFTVTPTTKIQFDANLVGPAISSQGKENTYFYCNLSARQQLFKRKLTAVLAFRDMFATARYNSSREAVGLSSYTRIRPVYPAITLTLSYTFNGFKGKESKTDSGELFEGSAF